MRHRSGRVRAASSLSVFGSRAARYRAGRFVRFSVLLLLLFVAGAVFVAPALAAGSMGGVVRDEFVVPIDSARVDVWRSPDGVSPYVWLGMDLSDAVGVYSVSTPGSGWYKVQFSDPLGRYVSEWWANKVAAGIDDADAVWLSEDQNANFVNAVLQNAGRAGGVVRAVGGGPLEGIRIDVFRWSDQQQQWVGTAQCYSAADGTWSAGGLASGQYRFHFRDETGGVYGDQFFDHQRTFASAHQVSISPGMNAGWIDADLEVGGFIGGVVRDGGGAPIGGITVTALVNDPSAGGWPGVRETTTSPLGLYTLGPLAPGEYHVGFHGSSAWVEEWWNDKAHDWQADVIDVQSNDTLLCSPTLERAGSIGGRVVADGSGDPVEGIEVAVRCFVGWDQGGWQDASAPAVTDSNGEYLVTGLRPGAFHVGFSDPDGDWAGEWYDDTFEDRAAEVEVTGGATSTVDASLAQGGEIAGVVRDTEGNPLPGIWVAACLYLGENDEEQWHWGWGTQADDNGSFQIGGLKPGRYQIELRDPNDVYAVQVYEDRLNSGEGIDLNVTAGGTAWADPVLEHGGVIYGQVVDENGDPLTNVQVSFNGWVDSPDGGGYEYYEESYTDERGEFTSTALQARLTTLYFQDQDGRCVGEWYNDTLVDADATPVDVRADRRYNVGRVVLAEGGHVAGTVTAAGGGDPLENIEVTIARWRDDWGDWDHFAGGQTDGEGHYDIGGLAAGDYRVGFRDGSGVYSGEWYAHALDAWTGQDVTVTQGGTTQIDAALEQACVIEGHVRDGNGDPLEGIEAKLLYREPQSDEWSDFWFEDERRIFTDGDGYFQLPGLPSRTYQLRLENGENPDPWATEIFDGALIAGRGTDLSPAPGETISVDPVLEMGGTLAGRLLDDQTFAPLSFAFPMEIGVRAFDPDAGPDEEQWPLYAGYATGDSTDGYMHGPGLAPGTYKVDFSCWTGSYVFETWKDRQQWSDEADLVTIEAGQTTDLGNVLLQRSAMIFGHLTGADGDPLPNVPVRVWTENEWGWDQVYEFWTWQDGYYQLGNLPGGTYLVEADGREIGLSRKFWDGATSQFSATPLVLAPREEVSGIDIQLEAAGTAIEGTVRNADGDPIAHAPVRLAVWDEAAGRYVRLDDDYSQTTTDGDGVWRIDWPSPGTYRVTAGPAGSEYGEASVEDVEVTTEQATQVDVVLPIGASISGAMVDVAGDPVQTGVELFRWSDDEDAWVSVLYTDAASDGTYTVAPIAPGTYRVFFGSPGEGYPYSVECWDNRRFVEDADDITVGEGEVVTGIDAVLGPVEDEQAPSAPDVAGADGAWHAASVDLTFSATDDLSGIEEYEFRVDGGAWRHGASATIAAPGSHANDGVHDVEVRAVDYVGHVSGTTQVQVKIDTTGPIVSDDDPGLWRRGPVTVDLSAVDEGCGVVDHIEYAQAADGPWQVGSAYVLQTWKRGGGSGERTMWVRAVDGLGNASEPATVVVRLDGAAPLTTHDSDGLPHATDVTVRFTINDAHSGAGWTYFSVDNGMWMVGDRVVIPALGGGQNDGVHWIRFYSVDAVGNVEPSWKWCTVVIDAVP